MKKDEEMKNVDEKEEGDESNWTQFKYIQENLPLLRN